MTFLLCDPSWYVHKPDVQNKRDDNTHTHILWKKVRVLNCKFIIVYGSSNNYCAPIVGGVHYRKSTGTGPVVLKVVRITGAGLSGIAMDQFLCDSLFPYRSKLTRTK